ncbi:Alpha/Beta hydrolase protein [Armillaria borealis]|uniref:carboxypeptidase C n=1 Tax=Armillaria borealis TaxID=47425 RepID=A0AA39J3T1_9AGAR|nr:Alpha/Beta hydrolase protein [Armillaria borealis]
MLQTPLNEGPVPYKLEDAQLSSLQFDKFTVVSHPRYPGHRSSNNFCCVPGLHLTNRSVYTGYLDVDQGAKHMFFYFFESRRNPDKDDAMMWINGGPGCSSSMGLLMELGTNILARSSLISDCYSVRSMQHRYGWIFFQWDGLESLLLKLRTYFSSTSRKSLQVLWLQLPPSDVTYRSVGVGFSYADYGETVETTEAAAKNVHAFITIFFETFKQFSGRVLHLSGESYGYDQNQIAKADGRPTLNLQSVLIGNGITDISTLYAGRYEIECGTAALDIPFQSISTCVRMKTALPRCQSAMLKGCIEQFDLINCRAAVNFCDNELSTGMWASGNVLLNCFGLYSSTSFRRCASETTCATLKIPLSKYLDLPETRELLGVETPYNFSACSSTVGQNFNVHMDKWVAPTQYYVAGLLDRGIRVLIYAGTYDWQCNWVANKLWVDGLDWSGKKEYNEAQWEDWFVGDSKTGEIKQTPLLTFATIRGAGHMISADPLLKGVTQLRKGEIRLTAGTLEGSVYARSGNILFLTTWSSSQTRHAPQIQVKIDQVKLS